MEPTILVQRLRAGTVTTSTNSSGDTVQELQAPTRLALEAARAIERLMKINDQNLQVIRSLQRQLESKYEYAQNTNDSSQASGQSTI